MFLLKVKIKEDFQVVLHKELRVLARGTPCAIVDTSGVCCYSGVSEEILARLIGIKSPIKDSFVKKVGLITSDNEEYKNYNFDHNGFLVITVKLKEDNVNEN